MNKKYISKELKAINRHMPTVIISTAEAAITTGHFVTEMLLSELMILPHRHRNVSEL